MRKKERTPDIIHSVDRAVNVLIALSNGLGRITDMAQEINLSHATLHRMLKTLEATGLVAQDPISRRYYLGHLIVKLASNPRVAHQGLVMCAIEEMKRLWDISEETVTLDIQVGTQRIHLQDIPSKHDLKVSREGMLKTPLYAGATGKVLLSQLGDNEVGVILKNMDLVPLTQNTITKKEILLEQLKKIRKQAHAVSFGERIDGAIGIAVSIKNYFHPTALSILGPEYRLRPRVKELIEEMRVSKRFIEESIMETAKAS